VYMGTTRPKPNDRIVILKSFDYNDSLTLIR